MKRSLSLLVAAVVIALVVAGCGSGASLTGSSTLHDAATLRYTAQGKQHTLHVSRDELLSEVGSIVANKPFATYLKQQGFTVDAKISADSRVSAIWLSQLIQQQAIDALFASRRLHVTSAQRAQAAKDVVGIFPGATIFPAFSSQFQATLIDRQARSEGLLDSYTDTSDTAGEAYFKANSAQFGCKSGKNVAHILVATQAAAQGILDQLHSGANFSQLAQQDSTDKQSGAQGGALGCLGANEFVAPFQNAAETAPVGTPVGPVHSQFGYHVILVTKAENTYDAARAQVLQALKSLGSQKTVAAIQALEKRFKVHVDPRFGTWGVSTDSQGQQVYHITPPTTPPVANSRDATTTTTAVPATTAPAASNGSP